jgi:uncharacterized membrane protein
MDIGLSISYFVHIVATVVWLGGMVIFSMFVWPEARRSIAEGNENRRFLLNLQRRFRPIGNFSLIVLLGTGMVQMAADPNYEGLLTFENTWSVAMLLKHIAFGGMVLVMLVLQFAIVPAVERAILLANKGQPGQLAAIQYRESRLNMLLIGLGTVVLIFTAIATAV